MTLAASSKDVRFYKWPNISYLGIYETPIDCMSVKSISWSCDGRELLVVKSKGCPVILAVPNKSEQYVKPCDCSYMNHATTGVFANNNPDMVAFGTEEGHIFVYNIKHTRHPLECLKLTSSIQNLEFSLDDQFIAVGCSSGPIVLLNSSYKPCASFVIPNSPFLSTLAYSKLSLNLLAAASKDGVLSLWNTETADNLFTSKQHTARITDLAFLDNHLSSVGVDGKFVSYDLRSYQTYSCELDCPLSSLAYLTGTYELAVSTTSGQLRSYDSRNMKFPLRTLVAVANSGIKKISFPSYPDIGSHSFKSKYDRKKFDDGYSASGDFSIASGSSPRRSHVNNKHIQPSNEILFEDNLSNIIESSSTPRIRGAVDFEEFQKVIDDKLKVTIKDFEEKLIQTFYKLRISTSKQFISLEEKISQNWTNFVDYLKFSGQDLTACQSSVGIQRSGNELNNTAVNTQIFNNEKCE